MSTGKENYRVELERRGTNVFGARKWFRKTVDVRAFSIGEAKRRAQLENEGWKATWAERKKPRRKM